MAEIVTVKVDIHRMPDEVNFKNLFGIQIYRSCSSYTEINDVCLLHY